MKFTTLLKKMITEYHEPIQYYMNLENDFIIVNQLIGKKIKLEHVDYQCLNCSNNRPIYRQGFCKTCFFDIPQAADWIIKPELSKAHLGIEDRDLTYEKQIQLQPHIVYLAYSGGVKVGVTRKTQVPTRWIDQGATQALPILETPNRYLAGMAEVLLKNHFSDKTNWRKMLTDTLKEIDLNTYKKDIKQLLSNDLVPYFIENIQPYNITYPIEKLSNKIISLNFDKTPVLEAILIGIKGQYWMFENGVVFNIRGNEGRIISIELI